MLDMHMLDRVGTLIARPLSGPTRPPSRPGTEVAFHLGGRYLVRYLMASQVGEFSNGSARETYVTPTAFAPEETLIWLNLPLPTAPRTHALLLRPEKIDEIIGPLYVGFSSGVQYILPSGFPKDAIVVPGAPGAGWEIVVS